MEEIKPIYSVSQLNYEIKNILNINFENIWVEGEVSGFKVSSLGHWYFDLKDENSIISCIVFKWNTKNFEFEIKDGLHIKVLAELTIFEKQSKYQLIIKDIIPVALGKLYLEFQKLKKKLEEEGLFDEKRKKKIPLFPKSVAVVTSLHGAAIRDIVTILKRRAPQINILIYPVKVQGEGAKEEIANAIKDINEKLPYVDVVLVGRGGGSIEDLWAFNEEVVARAIASSKIPIISCVGHQTDFTISDFVADLRAPTPSAAAEIVSKNAEDLIIHIKQLEKRLISTLKIVYHRVLNRFLVFTKSRFFKNPFTIIETKSEILDNLTENLMKQIDDKIKTLSEKLENLNLRLKNLNPLLPTKKGYSLIKKSGKLIKSIKDVNKDDVVDITVSDGFIKSVVRETERR